MFPIHLYKSIDPSVVSMSTQTSLWHAIPFPFGPYVGRDISLFLYLNYHVLPCFFIYPHSLAQCKARIQKIGLHKPPKKQHIRQAWYMWRTLTHVPPCIPSEILHCRCGCSYGSSRNCIPGGCCTQILGNKKTLRSRCNASASFGRWSWWRFAIWLFLPFLFSHPFL